MNHKLIIFITFLVICAFPAFGMIRRTTVSPQVMSTTAKSTSIPSVPRTSRFYSLPSVFYVPPLYKTSQKNYWWNQNENNTGDNSKWLNYFTAAEIKSILAGINKKYSDYSFTDIVSKDAKKKIYKEVEYEKRLEKFKDNYQAMMDITQDAQDIDPELYEVFLKIKDDYGIKEDIQLRIFRPWYQLLFKPYDALEGIFSISFVTTQENYNFVYNVVFLGSTYKYWSKSFLIYTLSHELEHIRQLKKMKGSYFDIDQDMKNDTKAFRAKLEIGAEAAAADYQYCSECLREVAQKTNRNNNPQETDFGYVTTPQGYFSKQDFKLWEDRAREACALCPAHKTGTHKNPNTPLKDFLPPKIEE